MSRKRHGQQDEIKMQEPIVALKIAPNDYMRVGIAAGRLTATIRMGHRDYQVGQQLALFCHLEPWAVMAEIDAVRQCRFGELHQDDLARAGFQNQVHAMTVMRAIYPNLTWNAPITLICWRDANGKPVDQERERKETQSRPAAGRRSGKPAGE